LEEGDYLEAEAVKDGILLKPVSIMSVTRQATSLALLERVHEKQSPSDTNPQDEEEEIARRSKKCAASMLSAVVDFTVLVSAFLSIGSGCTLARKAARTFMLPCHCIIEETGV
jgi:hypothetical protein